MRRAVARRSSVRSRQRPLKGHVRLTASSPPGAIRRLRRHEAKEAPMHLRSRTVIASILATFAGAGVVAEARPALANVTYQPYLEPGPSGSFGPRDQVVIAWQTDETSPSAAYSVEFEGRG